MPGPPGRRKRRDPLQPARDVAEALAAIKIKPPPRRKGKPTRAEKDLTTLAADTTLTIQDVADSTRKKKPPPPPRIVHHPGGDALTLLRPPPDGRDLRKRIAAEKDLRYKLALEAPVSPMAHALLRSSRPESLPPVFPNQPGLTEEQAKILHGGGIGDFLGELPGKAFGLKLPGPNEEDLSRWATQASDSLYNSLETWARKSFQGMTPNPRVQSMGVDGGPAAELFGNSLKQGLRIAFGFAPSLFLIASDPEAVGKGMGVYYQRFYGPVLDGDWDKFLANVRENPLQVPLDLIPLVQLLTAPLKIGQAVTEGAQFARMGGLITKPDGTLRPTTVGEAYARAVLFQQKPEEILPGTGIIRYRRKPVTRHIERERNVSTAGEDATIHLINDDGEVARIKTKDSPGYVGTHIANEDGSPTVIRHKDKNWRVSRIAEDSKVVQRYVPRSAAGVLLSDIYHWLRRGGGVQQKVFEQIEQERDNAFAKVSRFRAAAKHIKSTPEIYAFDRHLIYGDAAPEMARAEIRQRVAEGLDRTLPQQAEIQRVTDALPLIDNPTPELAQAIALGREVAKETEKALIQLGWLSDKAAKNMIRSQVAWTVPREVLKSRRRSEILASLDEAWRRDGLTDQHVTEQLALAMELLDQQARAWGKITGQKPELWYETNFSAANVIHQEELAAMVSSGDALAATRAASARRAEQIGEDMTYEEAMEGVDRKTFSPTEQRNIRRAIEGNLGEALHDGWDSRNWYRDAAMALLDHSGGNAEKADVLAQVVAIYSANTTMGRDFPLAMEAIRQWEADEPITIGADAKHPTTSKAAKAESVLSGGTWVGLKTDRFYLSMLRHIDPDKYRLLTKDMPGDPLAIDLQMMRFFGRKPRVSVDSKGHTIETMSLTPKEYAAYEQVTRNIARKVGIDPQSTQAVIWDWARGGTGRHSEFTDYVDYLDKEGGRIPFEISPDASPQLRAAYRALTPEARLAFNEEMVSIIQEFLDSVSYGGVITPGFTHSLWEGGVNETYTTIVPGRGVVVNLVGGGKDIEISAVTQQVLDEISATIAKETKQAAAVWFQTKYVAEGTVSLTRRNGVRVKIGRGLSAEETSAITEAMQTRGFQEVYFSKAPDGFYALDYTPRDSYTDFHTVLNDALGDILPDYTGGLEAFLFKGAYHDEKAIARLTSGARRPDIRQGSLRLRERSRDARNRHLGTGADGDTVAVAREPEPVLAATRRDRMAEQDSYPIAGIRREAVGPAELFLGRGLMDIASTAHEIAHQNLPAILEALVTSNDERIAAFEAATDIDLAKPISANDQEFLARLNEAYLYTGRTPAAYLRDFAERASSEFKQIFRFGIRSIARDADEVTRIENALKNPEVSSVLADTFDHALGVVVDPEAVFITRQRMMPFAGKGHRIRDWLKTAFTHPEKQRSQVRAGSRMKAFEAGEYAAGPEAVTHYSVAAVRNQFQAKTNQMLWDDHTVDVQIVHGVISPLPGHVLVSRSRVKGIMGRLDTNMTEVATRTEEALMDMEPQVITQHLQEQADEAVKSMVVAPGGDADLLQAVRDGDIKQMPEDILHAFVNATSTAYALGQINGVAGHIGRLLFYLPNAKARWNMISKPAYPILNSLCAEVLGWLNQGIFHPYNMRHISEYMSNFSPDSLAWADSVGGSSAVLAEVSKARPRGRLAKVGRAESMAFQKVMNWASMPERRVRRSALFHELHRYGIRTEEDLQTMIKMMETDPVVNAHVNAMIRLAEESMTRFRGMHPWERDIVRNIFFVYGWLRTATRFSAMFPLNHPFLAPIGAAMGEYGWDEMRKYLDQIITQYQGYVPTGEEKKQNGLYLQRALDLSTILPFSTAATTLNGLYGSFTGDATENLSQMLSPGADMGLTMIFGTDNYGNSLGDYFGQLIDPKTFPGAVWAARFIDPAITETHTKTALDRKGIGLLFLFGMAAPRDIKENMAYGAWLNTLPGPLRATVASMQHFSDTMVTADSAYRLLYGIPLPEDQGRALYADDALNVYTSFKLHQLNTELKKKPGHMSPEIQKLHDELAKSGKTTTSYLPPGMNATAKATIIKRFFPGAYEQLQTDAAGQDVQSTIDEIRDLWTELVSSQLSEMNDTIKQQYGSSKADWRPGRIQRAQNVVRVMEQVQPDVFKILTEELARDGMKIQDLYYHQSHDQYKIAVLVERLYERYSH